MISVKDFLDDYLGRVHTKDVVIVTMHRHALEELISLYTSIAIDDYVNNEVKEKI